MAEAYGKANGWEYGSSTRLALQEDARRMGYKWDPKTQTVTLPKGEK
jgi:hypothetical protein